MKSFLLAGLLSLGLALSATRLCADYPVASHRYLADPAALVLDDRVYVYCSNDDDNPVAGGYVIADVVCVSSTDLKNWTDHGSVFRATKDTTWAKKSWAPGIVARDGKIFLYFGNGGANIGVASSSSPVGPFTDPLGKHLIDAQTPGVLPAEKMWLFDPAAFVDDDGQAYLYFGGNGEKNVRVIKLNRDMISVDGPAIHLQAPAFFEAAWMHKRDGVYYLSYSTNPAAQMRIDYMTSDHPTSGFTYRGVVADQPPINNNNNHAAIFEFRGGWYHVFHNRIVAKQAGIPMGFRRNLALEPLQYDQQGGIVKVTYAADDIRQLAPLDPYRRVEGETFSAQQGVETEPCAAGGMNLTALESGDWIKLSGVDFGAKRPARFLAHVASGGAGATIELRLNSPDGTLVGSCVVGNTGGWQNWSEATGSMSDVTGLHDLYLRFVGGEGALLGLDWWRLERE